MHRHSQAANLSQSNLEEAENNTSSRELSSLALVPAQGQKPNGKGFYWQPQDAWPGFAQPICLAEHFIKRNAPFRSMRRVQDRHGLVFRCTGPFFRGIVHASRQSIVRLMLTQLHGKDQPKCHGPCNHVSSEQCMSTAPAALRLAVHRQHRLAYYDMPAMYQGLQQRGRQAAMAAQGVWQRPGRGARLQAFCCFRQARRHSLPMHKQGPTPTVGSLPRVPSGGPSFEPEQNKFDLAPAPGGCHSSPLGQL